VSSIVMNKAWRLKRVLYRLSFSTVLRLAWQIVKGRARVYHTKVTGVTFGIRQKLLEKLTIYSQSQVHIRFMRQPDNPSDRSAIVVVADVKDRGRAILGYLNHDLSCLLAPLLDSGRQAIIPDYEVTGGGIKKFGFNISYYLI